MKTPTLILVFGLSLASTSFAVDPPPDGGYAGENTAEGENALFSLTSGTNNSAVGHDALYNNTTGFSNVANGHNALLSNTVGEGNTANGESALYSNTAGNNSTATGAFALFSQTTGGVNTADGAYALYQNTTGGGNVAVGLDALYSNTTGNDNVAVGIGALMNHSEGYYNVAVGIGAVAYNTAGFGNVGIGGGALTNSIGSYNTALGDAALGYLRVGSYNLGVGKNAGFKLTSGDWNIYVGNIGVGDESGTIRIGDRKRHTNTYITGISGVTIPTGVGVIVDNNGHLGTVTSSARYKDNIQPMEKSSEAILSLKPVTFRYKKELDPDSIPQFGLVAEDVAKVDPDLVARDGQGKPYTVRYEAVNAMLLNEFLKAHRTIERQEKKIEALEAAVAKLQAARWAVDGLCPND